MCIASTMYVTKVACLLILKNSSQNIFYDLSAGELDNGYKIRRAAIDLNIPLITNARLASAFIQAFCTLSVDDICIKSWQEYK